MSGCPLSCQAEAAYVSFELLPGKGRVRVSRKHRAAVDSSRSVLASIAWAGPWSWSPANSRTHVYTGWRHRKHGLRSRAACSDAEGSRGVVWVEPRVVVEVSYSEVMLGRLRDPVLRSLKG